MVSAEFSMAAAMIGPLYNITLIFLLFFLLYKLISVKKVKKHVFIKPWYYLFFAISIFLLESLLTATKAFGIITDAVIPRWFNAVFELGMVILFNYMLFTQVNHVAGKYRKKKSF